MMGTWRNAASLILACRNHSVTNSTKYDYKILMLRRSARSSFMPHNYVFPGGVFSAADSSIEWNNMIPNKSNLNMFFPPPGTQRPLLLQNDGYPSMNQQLLSKDVAYRITALRETFEESGVLLLTLESPPPLSDEIRQWRSAVQEYPSCFRKMCDILRICPDIWALFEWSCWLTPISKLRSDQGSSRFDTIFYLACIDDVGRCELEATHDSKETSSVLCADPETLLREKYLQLAPPQIYELSRLLNFYRLDELKTFAQERQAKGLESMLPVILKCFDGVLSILPGDQLYPDRSSPINLERLTIDQVMEKFPLHHRFIKRKEKEYNIQISCQNFAAKYGHINPVCVK